MTYIDIINLDTRKNDVVCLFDPEDRYGPVIANQLRDSGFEPYFFRTLDEFKTIDSELPMVCIVNGDLTTSVSVANAYREINESPFIRMISVSEGGSFDDRLELTRIGIDYALFYPINTSDLIIKVNYFYQKLYPGDRDIMLTSLLGNDSKILPILNSMENVHVVKSEVRDIFYNLEHYDQVMTIVESENDSDQGVELLKSIAISHNLQGAPLLLVFPNDENDVEPSFCVTTSDISPIVFKIYADSMDDFIHMQMDTAGLKQGYRLYDEADFISTTQHHNKIIDLIDFSNNFNIPLCVCSFKIDNYHEILNTKGKEESRKLYNKLSHIVSDKLKHTDFIVRIAMDRMVVFFLGNNEQQAMKKSKQIKEIFKLMPNEFEEGVYISTLSVGILQVSDMGY